MQPQPPPAHVSLTDAAAWWGAILATLAIAWDIFKWRRSNAPRVRLVATSDTWTVLGDHNLAPSTLSVRIHAENRGERPTTVTGIEIERHERGRLFRTWRLAHRSDNFLGLPHLLPPGEVFSFSLNQRALQEMATLGPIRVRVSYSGADRPATCRLRLPPPPSIAPPPVPEKRKRRRRPTGAA